MLLDFGGIRAGSKENPFSVSDSTRSPTLDERIRAQVATTLLKKIFGPFFFFKFDPVSMRLVANPLGAAVVLTVYPKDTATCQTRTCDYDADGWSDEHYQRGEYVKGFN